ncbi:MAG: Rieske 2Fe-2S domain-containing protein [Nitrosomonadales bacterium]
MIFAALFTGLVATLMSCFWKSEQYGFSYSATGFEVCALGDIPDGNARLFSFPIEQQVFRLLILRSGENCIGYLNRCPHFGMPLAESDSQLIYESNCWVKCNVHYARFRWHDGFCVAGDCEGESLQKVPLEVQSGQDTGNQPYTATLICFLRVISCEIRFSKSNFHCKQQSLMGSLMSMDTVSIRAQRTRMSCCPKLDLQRAVLY